MKAERATVFFDPQSSQCIIYLNYVPIWNRTKKHVLLKISSKQLCQNTLDWSALLSSQCQPMPANASQCQPMPANASQ
jgi:hypothetical protein